jgi:hypothetical protein
MIVVYEREGPGLQRVLKKGLLFLEGRLERGAEA